MSAGWEKSRRQSVSRRTRFGAAQLLPDHERPSGWRLLVDGVPQSYVDDEDPMFLGFEYARRLGSVIDNFGPRGVPLRVVHLGGGALMMARYIAITRPGSVQRVIDRDDQLIDFVRSHLPLPHGTDLTVQIDDARSGLDSLPAGDADLLICDVYQGAQMPRSVSDIGFAAQAARVVRDDGLLAVNIADLPPLAFTRSQAATLRTAFRDLAVIAGAALLRGKRYGNTIVVAAHRPGRIPIAPLILAATKDPLTGQVLHGTALSAFTAGATPQG